MRRLLILAILVLVPPVATLVGCGGKDDHPYIAQKPATPPATHAADSAAMVSIDWCIVSGDKLGSVGDPVPYKYKDRDIAFCCKSCVEQFEADPIRYLARLDSAQAGQIKQPVDHHGHSH